MISLAAYLEEKKNQVEAFLESYFQPSSADSSRLIEAMKYSLLAGGKRLRPALVFGAFEASQTKKDSVLQKSIIQAAAALEMIHTYSLIHDDLPAMDDDDLRRGRPTSHKMYGEGLAILAGDSLLTEAFQILSRLKGLLAESVVEILADIADAAGWRGMAGGQAFDLESEGKTLTVADLEKLHRHKTGRLIEVSLTTGAKIASASTQEISCLQEYGRAVGLAFQIADDVLDQEGEQKTIGKTPGKDLKKEKSTYPSLVGLETSKRLAADLVSQALQSLKSFGPEADPLRAIAHYIVERKS